MKKYLRYMIFFAAVSFALVFAVIMSGRDRSVVYTNEDLDSNDEMTDFYTPGILLNKGTFRVEITYASDAKVRLDFFGNRNDNYIDELAPCMYGDHFEREYVLTKDSQGAKLRFEIPEGAILFVSEIRISSDELLYTDGILFALLAAAVLTGIFIFADRKLYRDIKADTAAAYLIMAAGILLAFCPHMFGTLGDGNDLGGQLIRMEGVKDAILDGQFPVVLFPRTLGEYGELGSMYPYLFVIIPAVLRILDVSVLTSYGMTLLAMITAVTLVMYRCLRAVGVSRIVSSAAAVSYLLSPAFIHGETDNGAALGAGFAYIFIPLVLVSMYQVFNGERNKRIWLTVGFSGLIESHLVTTLMMIPCCAALFVILTVRNIRASKPCKECFIDVIVAALWCIPLNIWWITIFAYYYIKGNLYLGALGDTFRGLGPDALFSYEVTWYLVFLMVLIIVLIIFSGIKERSRDRLFACVMLCFAVFGLFACSSFMPWKQLRAAAPVSFFTNTMQFPTRFFVVISACVAISFALAVDEAVHKAQSRGKIMLIAGTAVIFVSAVLCNFGYVRTYMQKDNVFCTNITGDIAPFKQREYLPDGTGDECFTGKYSYSVSDDEAVTVYDYVKNGDRVSFGYTVTGSGNDEYIELPMFYYPGYEIRTGSWEILPGVTGDFNHMRINLPGDRDNDTVTVRFKVNPLFGILAVFSAAAFVVFVYTEKKHGNV